jgi:hypothetical protein
MNHEHSQNCYWCRKCPKCGGTDLRVIECRVLVGFGNCRGVPIDPDGFSFRDVGYDTDDLRILCGTCNETMPWDECPRIVSEPSPEDIADASLTAAVLEGAFP